jgi:hypothetical protein
MPRAASRSASRSRAIRELYGANSAVCSQRPCGASQSVAAHHGRCVVVRIAPAHRSMALRNQAKQTISPSKSLDESVVKFSVSGLVEGPYQPWVEGIISCSVCDISNAGQQASAYIYTCRLHRKMIEAANLKGRLYPCCLCLHKIIVPGNNFHNLKSVRLGLPLHQDTTLMVLRRAITQR